MYLLILMPAYIVCYYIFTYFFQIFFKGKILQIRSNFLDIFIVLFLFIGWIFVTILIPDAELSNRFQHAFSGGFCITLLLYYAYKASGIHITRCQFFVISLLIATFCGVGNEMLEFLGQKYLGIMFASNVEDTWLDLYANTFGIIVGTIISIVFWKKYFYSSHDNRT